jgi:hypothetical protein
MVVQDSDDSAIVSSWVKRQSQLPSLRVLDAGIQGNGVSTCDLGPPGEATIPPAIRQRVKLLHLLITLGIQQKQIS